MLSLFILTLVIQNITYASYSYVECNCSADFKTRDGNIITVSDFVYCPKSEQYNFDCSGDVIGNSLDVICKNNNGDISKAPNWDAPKGLNIYGALFVVVYNFEQIN